MNYQQTCQASNLKTANQAIPTSKKWMTCFENLTRSLKTTLNPHRRRITHRNPIVKLRSNDLKRKLDSLPLAQIAEMNPQQNLNLTGATTDIQEESITIKHESTEISLSSMHQPPLPIDKSLKSTNQTEFSNSTRTVMNIESNSGMENG